MRVVTPDDDGVVQRPTQDAPLRFFNHQIEGGAVQACSIALKEAVQFDRSGVTSHSWESYPILRFSEVPEVTTQLLARPQYQPFGVGECSLGPTVAAIANAIHDALGVRPLTTPFTPDHLSADMT